MKSGKAPPHRLLSNCVPGGAGDSAVAEPPHAVMIFRGSWLFPGCVA